ncbi:MAG: hypothetical protein WB562_10375 [Candidatus Sulfotelmatobacter sp.]
MIAYAVLVILPLFALAGILRAGHTVKAPISVDGTWNLQIDSALLDSLPCGKTLAATPDKALVISQSGKGFVLAFANGPKATASGTLEGTTLRASLIPSADWSREIGCGAAQQLSLTATVDLNTRPRSMFGRLSADNCTSCTPVALSAFQQTPPPPKGGH